MIEKARKFAEAVHQGQVRKYNGKPYFTHPERVAKRLQELGYPPEMVAAGYLHDVVEDCGVKIEEIEAAFGPKVAELVSGLTNPSKGLKLSRAKRKQIDREHLEAQGTFVKIIKLVDRIDNIKDLEGADADFKKLYLEETMLLIPCLYGECGLDNPTYYNLMSQLGKLVIEMTGS